MSIDQPRDHDSAMGGHFLFGLVLRQQSLGLADLDDLIALNGHRPISINLTFFVHSDEPIGVMYD